MTRWVYPQPVKPKYTRPVFYPNPKYTRPVFNLNPYTPDPYLTRLPELTGLMPSIWLSQCRLRKASTRLQ